MISSDLSAASAQAALNDAMRELSQLRTALRSATQRLVTLQEEVQHAISHELHDDIGQQFVAIKLASSAAQREQGVEKRNRLLDEVSDIADRAIFRLRDVSLLLRAPELDALGLEGALRAVATALFRSNRQQLHVDIDQLPPLDNEVELACFRVAQEALSNAVQHSNAENVTLRIRHDTQNGTLRLTVQDDGATVNPETSPGLGLLTMRDRTESLGGSWSIANNGVGTTIDASFPIDPRNE